MTEVTYKIGEAAALLNLKTYVLRFWETEFPDIVPLRTGKGQRLYTAEHLALLERIRFLLHDRGLTIGGARKILEEEKARGVVYTAGIPGSVPREQLSGAFTDLGDLSDTPEPADADDTAHLPGLLPHPYREASSDRATPHTSSRAAGARKGQCNLPGIEPLFLSPVSTPAETAPGSDSSEAPQPFPTPLSDSTKGMLPLFTPADEPPTTGETATGGRNFLQPGLKTAKGEPPLTQPDNSHHTSAAPEQPNDTQLHSSACGESPEPPLRHTPSSSFLREIMEELTAVTKLLQTPATQLPPVPVSTASAPKTPSQGTPFSHAPATAGAAPSAAPLPEADQPEADQPEAIASTPAAAMPTGSAASTSGPAETSSVAPPSAQPRVTSRTISAPSVTVTVSSAAKRSHAASNQNEAPKSVLSPQSARDAIITDQDITDIEGPIQ